MKKQKRPKQHGKRIMNHSSLVEGLDRFLITLEDWPEIETIRPGRIRVGGVVGRKHNKPGPIYQSPRSAGLGGGFTFRATRWAMIGGQITAILCMASYGRAHQEVFLTSEDYRALRARLVREGYLSDE